MARRLWKVIGGEPFMINPYLGILGANPRQKKGKKVMARKHGAAHMAWVRSFKKNPRRHRRRKHNPSVRHYARRARSSVRRHARRAATAMGFLTLPPLQSVLYVGVGLAGTPLAEGFISGYLPAAITGNTIGKYAVKIATVLGLSYLVKSIMGREQGKLVAVGGGVYVVMSAVRQFAPGFIPGMSAYAVGGPVVTGLNAYTGPKSLSAYTSNRGMSAPAFGATNTVGFAGQGGRNVVASRFRRFQ